MKSYTWIWAAVAWVVVVVAVSTVTWAVIDSAGRNVLAQDGGIGDGPPPTSRAMTPGPGTPSTSETDVTRSPTGTGEPPATDTPSVAPPPPATSPSSVAPPLPSSSPPAPTAAPSAGGVTRTWQGTAGTVTVRCVGDRINLQSASPGDGWRVEVDEQGPEKVKVELTSGGQDDEVDEREVHVEARCAGATPRFQVEQD